ncbi:hypothetical protein SAMN02910289_00400 [Lachnospiraceae bacterium RM5]|nr:hypothetical protein SAMN02910289_00400 [Lachnospiraceae bacterium RM5]
MKREIKKIIFCGVSCILTVGLLTSCGDKVTVLDDKVKQSKVESNSGTENNNNDLQIQVGQYVEFGTYEQDGDDNNGDEPIEWKVLVVKDGKALLISKCVLDWQKYNETDEKVNWSTCSLRTWLNKDFYREAFDQEEMNRMVDTVITSDGIETYDLVFILNKTEMETYFHSDDERISEPTEITKLAARDTQNSGFENKEGCWYWVCGNGTLDKAPYVSKAGAIEDNTDYVDWYYGIRPAIWITINQDSE